MRPMPVKKYVKKASEQRKVKNMVSRPLVAHIRKSLCKARAKPVSGTNTDMCFIFSLYEIREKMSNTPASEARPMFIEA